MKKLFILLALVFSASVFAKPIEGGEKIAETFLKNGSFVKFFWDEDNIGWLSKSAVSYIQIDEDDIEINTPMSGILIGFGGTSASTSLRGMTKMAAGQNDGSSIKLKVDKYDISLDNDSNIIVKKK